MVLDNSNTPIPGVTIRALLTNVLNSNSTAVQSAAAVQTDAQGQFRIQPVDKDLLFRLLVTAPGHRPDYIRDADPMFGGAQLKMKRLQVAGVPAASRVIVHNKVYDQFLGKLVDRAKSLRVGNGLDDGVDVGPQINEQQVQTSAKYVEIGRNEGARLLFAGQAATMEGCRR